MDINKEGTHLKIKRASHLPVSVPRTAKDVLINRKAVKKHMAHNKDLRDGVVGVGHAMDSLIP